MDSGTFDSLVKSLAAGRSRRSVLKGLLGFGSAAAVGGILAESGADAARRPTPTPKPVTCPGSQHWDGSACVCTSGETCGSACCLIGSECCDGACCFGHCYGEERCCSYDNWCDAAGECCPDGATCCGEQGCIVIEEGDCGCDGACPDGFACCGSQCCAIGFCAGETCCALGVCGEQCLTNEGDECCAGAPYDPDEASCCDGTIVDGAECCATDDCDDGFECCGGVCCAEGYCAGDLCCATPACAGNCIGDASTGCCAGKTCDMSVYVCCDDQIIEGNCCDDSDCGTCVHCEENHRCGLLRC